MSKNEICDELLCKIIKCHFNHHGILTSPNTTCCSICNNTSSQDKKQQIAENENKPEPKNVDRPYKYNINGMQLSHALNSSRI